MLIQLFVVATLVALPGAAKAAEKPATEASLERFIRAQQLTHAAATRDIAARAQRTADTRALTEAKAAHEAAKRAHDAIVNAETAEARMLVQIDGINIHNQQKVAQQEKLHREYNQMFVNFVVVLGLELSICGLACLFLTDSKFSQSMKAAWGTDSSTIIASVRTMSRTTTGKIILNSMFYSTLFGLAAIAVIVIAIVAITLALVWFISMIIFEIIVAMFATTCVCACCGAVCCICHK